VLNTNFFGNELKKVGFNFYTGVPCSSLKNFINYAINECEYIAAANEGDAIAIASGAYLGGKRAVVLMQNSGLTNAVSPLTSLNYIFKIPILGFVSLRGEAGIEDEPQHELMGQITTQILELMRIQWEYLSSEIEGARSQLLRANESIEENQTFFFVVRKGIFGEVRLNEQRIIFIRDRFKVEKSNEDQMPIRIEALKVINGLKDKNTILLATTGKTGRELYEIEDAPNNLYVVGSMGCVSSLGFGLALVMPEKEVVVIDGDGSILMRMGSLATNGYYCPPNMIHILLDNNAHDSTGGQATVSFNVNFVQIAKSCGYPRSIYVHNLDELRIYIKNWKKEKELTFLYMKIGKGSKENLGRPGMKPYHIKERLLRFINE